MSERPIIFSPDSVRAILAGTKTQTRRVVKPQPDGGIRRSPFVPSGIEDGHGYELRSPYGAPGELLWVKEAWAVDAPLDEARAAHEDIMRGIGYGPYYKADKVNESAGLTWRNAMYMPRWASRLTLRITEVRVERLQAISDADICAELGWPVAWPGPGPEPYTRDLQLAWSIRWDEINAKRGYGWDSNPWVWCVSFEVVR